MKSELNVGALAALQSLTAELESRKLLTQGPAYDVAKRVWNSAVRTKPELIVRCENRSDVQAAVKAAVTNDLTLSVRAGGHGWAGRAVRGQLVIDLSGMRAVRVEGREAIAEGGATSLDVVLQSDPHGLAPVTGNLGSVGISGLTLGGGYGPLTGALGLASDSLVGAEVVTARGEFVTTDEQTNPELLWALRGGGGNFGVVTSLRLKLHPMTDFFAGTVSFPWEKASAVMQAFGAYQPSAPDGLTLTTALAPGPDGTLAVTMLYAWRGSGLENEQALAVVRKLGERSVVNVSRMSYLDMLKGNEALLVPNVSSLYRTLTLVDIPSGAMDAIVDAMNKRSSPLSYIVFHPLHGAATRIPLASTSFGIRRTHFVVGIFAFWQDGDGAVHKSWADAAEASLKPYAIASAYPNYFGPDRPEQALHAFAGNADRLLAIKRQYDPEDHFKANALPSNSTYRVELPRSSE